MEFKTFVFNAFQENTYLLYDETKEAIIIDAGCSDKAEEQQLIDFIAQNNLKVVKLLNTHGHIDHILGLGAMMKQFQVDLLAHENFALEVEGSRIWAQAYAVYGIHFKSFELPTQFLKEGDVFQFGNTQLEVLFTPGHSPAHLSFFHRESKQLFSGDVLFYDSIGRTDLPGGNLDTLIDSIFTKLFPLGDDVKVYSGHYGSTTIGREKRMNPFLQA